MKNKIVLMILILAFCIGINFIKPADARPADYNLRGKILLQVESKGQAWYVNPDDGKRYYFKNKDQAVRVIQQLGTGISNENLNKIPIGLEKINVYGKIDSDHDGLPNDLEIAIGTDPQKKDSDNDGYNDWTEISTNHNPVEHKDINGKEISDNKLISQLKGKILLQVEGRGESWYVHPANGKRYYLASPQITFEIIKSFGIGASNEVINDIDEGLLKRQKVIKVIDGDTIQVESGAIIRYIGIDAPEVNYDDCFGQKAFDMNRQLVENKEVELIQDVSIMDKERRFLAYVYANGLFVNEYLVKNGYAFALSYAPDVKYSNILSEHQRKAKYERRGLWGECFK